VHTCTPPNISNLDKKMYYILIIKWIVNGAKKKFSVTKKSKYLNCRLDANSKTPVTVQQYGGVA